MVCPRISCLEMLQVNKTAGVELLALAPQLVWRISPTSWCGESGPTSWCGESGPTSWCGESDPTSWCGESAWSEFVKTGKREIRGRTTYVLEKPSPKGKNSICPRVSFWTNSGFKFGTRQSRFRPCRDATQPARLRSERFGRNAHQLLLDVGRRPLEGRAFRAVLRHQLLELLRLKKTRTFVRVEMCRRGRVVVCVCSGTEQFDRLRNTVQL